jgi:hypothetical protein
MTTINKPLTIDGLIMNIYEDNSEHFDFIYSMNNGDCDCCLHFAMNLIKEYDR